MLIHEFPFEEQQFQTIQTQLADVIDYSKRLLLSIRALLNPPVAFQAHFADPVVGAALSLLLRACRRYRQVIALSELGQADGADVIGRSMFESFLTIAFVCREQVQLSRRNSSKPANQFGKELTREFRAKLYYTHSNLKKERFFENLRTVANAKHVAEEKLNERPGFVDSAIEDIGPEWSRAIKKENTCAGLSIQDLSHSLGVYDLYRTIYAQQSFRVHSADAGDYLKIADGNSQPSAHYQSDVAEIKAALWCATTMVHLAAQEFGVLLDMKSKSYSKEISLTNSPAVVREVFRMGV